MSQKDTNLFLKVSTLLLILSPFHAFLGKKRQKKLKKVIKGDNPDRPEGHGCPKKQ